MAKLEVRGLNATYTNANRREVLRDITFELDAGKVLLINGYNGAGKSTLLKVLAGLIPSTSGVIVWDDQEVKPLSPGSPIYPWVGLLMQAGNVFNCLSVRRNVELAMDRSGSRSKPNYDQVLIEFPILSSLWNKRAGFLSGGQRKILALVLGTFWKTPLLLLDEPLAGLSGENIAIALAWLQKKKQDGASMIIVEHSVSKLASNLIDLQATMINGKLSPFSDY